MSFDPNKTDPGVMHAQRIQRLAETMAIRMRHVRAMKREGWRPVATGLEGVTRAGASGFAFVVPRPQAIDDFEITIEGDAACTPTS